MSLPPMAKQDADQVLRYAFDETTGKLRVDATVTVPPLDISAADGANIAIASQDGTQFMEVNVDGSINITDNGGEITVDGTVSANQSGTWNINNVTGTVSLPTGAATQTTLASALTELQTSNTNLVNITTATDNTDTNTAATVTELQTANVSLVNIDNATDTTASNTTQALSKLDDIIAKDFATEATQLNVETTLNAISTSVYRKTIISQIDAILLDTSVSNIPASASAPLQIVASANSTTTKMLIVEDIGEYMGLYVGGIGSEVLVAVLPLGGGEVELEILRFSRVSIRAMQNTAISSGKLAINFIA